MVDVRAHGDRLLATLPVARSHDFANDAEAAFAVQYPEIALVAVPAGSGTCAIDGAYRPGPPPTIEYAMDTSAERRHFTLLHELGHHLIELDPVLADFDGQDTDRRDEDICNRIAARLLIPTDIVDDVIDGYPTAQAVIELRRRTRASRAACCVAAAERLRHPGCVMYGWSDGIAQFVGHHPSTPWRVARSADQGDDSVLAEPRRQPGRSHVRFAGGNPSGELWVDCSVDDDGRVFAVFVEDTVSPWAPAGALHLPEVSGPAYEEVECSHCDNAFRAYGAPCPRCGDHLCPDPDCGRCSCPLGGGEERRCIECMQKRPVERFPDGGNICDDHL